MTNSVTFNRVCPHCGNAKDWDFGLVRHQVGKDRIVHFKARFNSPHEIMATILVNGQAQKITPVSKQE